MPITVGRHEVIGWVEDLLVVPAGLDEVLAKTALASRVRNWAESVMADLARAASGYSPAGVGAGAAAVLQAAGNLSSRDVRGITKRADLITRAPIVGEAMAAGDLGAAQADALARSAGRATAAVRRALLAQAEELVDAAKTMTPEEFEAHCEQTRHDLEPDDGASEFDTQRRQSFLKRWTDKHTGMRRGQFALDPERGDRLFAAIDAERDALWAEQSTTGQPSEIVLEQLGAQALVNLVADGHATKRVDPDVHVLIDYDTLLRGSHTHSVCELSDGTSIPVGTARRLACAANILPVLLGSHGEVLDLGRGVRLATRAQRRALRAMYRHCAYKGCDVAFDRCQIHHVHWFELLGPTNLGNLIPLCWRHHHLVHEGGWDLSIDPDRNLTIRRPDGELHTTMTFATIARSHRFSRKANPPTNNAPPGEPPANTGPPPDTGPPADTGPPGTSPNGDFFTAA